MTAEDAILDADLYSDEDLEEADIVEWYEARPMTVSTYVATGAVIGAAGEIAVRIEPHHDPFADPIDFRTVGETPGQGPRQGVHLIGDLGAGGAAQHGPDNRAARRRAGLNQRLREGRARQKRGAQGRHHHG